MSGSDDEDLEVSQARVGTVLHGKWTLDSLLGVGGMAAVYSATHKLGQRAAIKILHPHIAVSKEMRARFEQEALASSKLEHAGTVEVFDVDATEDGAPFMVMELLDGESLGQRAYRLGGIPEPDLFRTAQAVLSVMIVAHDAGIVHRDIKPDNLFITKSGAVKVLDFGIARMRERGPGGVRTRTGALLGTTPYMAPEQVHAKVVDGRADLFAIGATLFRILTKRRIHEAETDAELMMKMGSTPAPPIRSVNPEVSPAGALIIDRALTFDRDQRYPDARTMLADVEQLLRGEAPAFATRAAKEQAERTAPERPNMTSVAPAASHALPASGYGPMTGPALAPARTNLGLVIAVGAIMLVGGAIGAALYLGASSSSEKDRSSTASEDDDDDDDDRKPTKSARPTPTPTPGTASPEDPPSATPTVTTTAEPTSTATATESPSSTPTATATTKPKPTATTKPSATTSPSGGGLKFPGSK